MNQFKSYTIVKTFYLSLILLSLGCKKTKETYPEKVSISELLPVSIGRETYYRLDSTIIALNSTNTTPKSKSYLLKEVVSSEERDNLNQPYWKVDKYLSEDLEGNGTWYPAGFYFISYFNDRIELTENNLRFIKLVRPVRENYTWKGNTYLPNNPLEDYFKELFEFDNIEQNMKNWLYTYKSIGENVTLPGQLTLQDVTTVEQINQNNIPDGFVFGSSTAFNGYASQEYAVEKYAKNKGLIYQELELWEYQSNKNETKGYRLKKWLVNP